MRIDRIALRGIGPFRTEVALDLAALPGPLVAICGGNGAGKTTLLEAGIAGALFRRTPTRGTISDLAVDRHGSVEARVVNGAAYTIRHVVDPVSGKGESLVLDADGRVLVESAKRTDYDAWAAKHLPTPEVLFASVFSAQGSGGFLDMRPGERKALLLRVLGIEHLEQLAERARAHVRDASERVRVLEARIADERARGGDPDDLHERLSDALMAAAQADSAIAEARARLDEARATHARQSAEHAETTRRHARVVEITTEHTRTIERARDLAERIANNRRVLADAKDIRAAVDRVAELDVAIAASEADVARLHAQHCAASDRMYERHTAEERAGDREQSILTRARAARKAAEDAATLRPMAGGLEAARDVVGRAAAVELAARERVETLRTVGAHGAAKRIGVLREGLTIIRDGAGRVAYVDVAREYLSADDDNAARVASAPHDIEVAKAEQREAGAALDRAREDMVRAERAAERLAALGDVDGALAAVERELADVRAERAALLAAAHEADVAGKAAAVAAETARKRGAALVAERQSLAATAKLAGALEQAQARIAELEPQLADAQANARELRETLDALAAQPAPTPPDTAALDRAERDVRDAEERARKTAATVALAEDRVRVAEASDARVVELDGERATIETELADWTRLAADLGRDGLQAAEIDAAGPELTSLINDLLHTCVGTRWTVAIETTRLSADGKKTIEGCEVRVIDTERGRDAAAETLSGGERVIVGEAVSLALAMLACRRSGLEGCSIVRDESGAALDPVNARRYVAMLRRAADLVRASRVLLVSHSEDVQAMCDSRVLVRDGRVEVSP